MKTKTSKTIVKLGAMASAICIACGAGLMISKALKNGAPAGKEITVSTGENQKRELPKITDENGNELNTEKYYAMPKNMSFTAVTQSNEAGNEVSNAVTANVIATITPSNAANKKVDWSIAFKNAESEWSSGKAVGDYVSVMPSSDGSLMAAITCYQAFGEKIIVTVTSRENAEAKASCEIDYKQQFTGYALSVTQENKTPSVSNEKKTGTLYADFSTAAPITLNYTYEKSDTYTMELPDSEIAAPAELSITYKSPLLSALKNISESAAKLPTATAKENGFEIKDLFNKTYADGIASAADYNKAITALNNNSSGAVIAALKDSRGNTLVSYSFTVDTKAIKTQIKPESVTLSESMLSFGEQGKTYKITYRAAQRNFKVTIFEKGSEFGLSKQEGGNYPETYVNGVGATISDLKPSFSCSGENGDYHSGSGSGSVTYKFKGWYLDWAATIPFNGTIPADHVGDITLYAAAESNGTHFY